MNNISEQAKLFFDACETGKAAKRIATQRPPSPPKQMPSVTSRHWKATPSG